MHFDLVTAESDTQRLTEAMETPAAANALVPSAVTASGLIA